MKFTKLDAYQEGQELEKIRKLHEVIFPYQLLRSETYSIIATPTYPHKIDMKRIQITLIIPPEYDRELQSELEAWDLASSEALDNIDPS